jgi:hypothetical protein
LDEIYPISQETLICIVRDYDNINNHLLYSWRASGGKLGYKVSLTLKLVRETEASIVLGGWWVLLGVLSSVGLGTGLHTFVLYLGPFIAKVTMAATGMSTPYKLFY